MSFRRNHHNLFHFLIVFGALVFFLSSCSKKNKSEDGTQPTTPPPVSLSVVADHFVISTENVARLTVTGGSGTVSYVVKSGPGAISQDGVFSPQGPGEAVIEVTDESQTSHQVTLQVVPALEVSPLSEPIAVRAQVQLMVSGGVPPLVFSQSSLDGSFNENGIFKAPSEPGPVIIQVTDKIGNQREITVTTYAIQKMISGGSSSCVLDTLGRVRCWGSNSSGQLGTENAINYGSAPSQMGANLRRVNLGTGRTAKDLALGQSHACAILDNDRVKCWGSNSYGQLGLESTLSYGRTPGSMGDALPEINLGTGLKARKIFAGHAFTCAILDNDAVKCWGRNNFGQLGVGSTTNLGSSAFQMGDNLPALNLGASGKVVSLALGSFHGCALFEDGQIKCWGQSNFGQLGLEDTRTRGVLPGDMGDQLPAVNLGQDRKAQALVAGIYHTCALLDNGGVRCWGRNFNGQLGIGSTTNRGTAPGQMGDNLPYVYFGNSIKAKSLSANYDSTCAILENDELKCWGLNESGELGIENTINIGSAISQMGPAWPGTVLGAEMTSPSLSSGRNFFCALSLENRVKCWGNARSGALGNGSVVNHLGDSDGEMDTSLPFLDL